jgi:hypothetical protein
MHAVLCPTKTFSPRRRQEREEKNFTAKTPRAQRELKTKKTREDIEQIVELVADAMLEVNRALGRRAAGIGFVGFLGALSVFAVKSSLRWRHRPYAT